MENDELWRMGTGSTANKRKSDQPEEATVEEQRVDDIVMDHGLTRCGRDQNEDGRDADGSGHGHVK